MQRVFPSNISHLDEQISGGLREKTIFLMYGEAGTGKTTLAIQYAVNCARAGFKTIYLDCDHSFFPKRMKQIAGIDFDDFASQIVLMRPENFKQQTFVLERLEDYISDKVGLIIIDSITNFYRENLQDNIKKVIKFNRELNRQMAMLAQITKTRKVASLVIGQVRGVIYNNDGLIRPVAMRVLKFWADTTLHLSHDGDNLIKAVIESRVKNRSMRVKPIYLEIRKNGLYEIRK